MKEEAAEKEDNNQAVQAVPVKEEAAEKEDNNEKSRRRQEEETPKEEEAAEKEDKNESTQPSSLTILASSHIVQGEQMAKLIEEVNSLRARVATMEATGQVVSPSGSGPQGFWKSSTGWWWWQNYVATCFCRHHEQGGATYGELVLAFLKNAWSTYNKCVIIAWLMQA